LVKRVSVVGCSKIILAIAIIIKTIIIAIALGLWMNVKLEPVKKCLMI
jgi:hypothetical protein